MQATKTKTEIFQQNCTHTLNCDIQLNSFRKEEKLFRERERGRVGVWIHPNVDACSVDTSLSLSLSLQRNMPPVVFLW
jgi:hypothetical protein